MEPDWGVGRLSAKPCRLCSAELTRTFVDLGMSPPCEDFLTAARAAEAEIFYPLHVLICADCLLVQLPKVLPPEEIFTYDYAYHSSYSTSWVEHSRLYASEMAERLSLGPESLVVEVASNDGYLLQHFVSLGIPVLGVEPAGAVAAVAVERGVPTRVCFLGSSTAQQITQAHRPADLVVANNVFAHVDDLRDFVSGLATLLGPHGMLTLEFPHLKHLIEGNQFDTIYHEHYSYFTLLTAARALALSGMVVVDVEELSTHGGSLRVYAQHHEEARAPSRRVQEVLAAELAAGLHELAGYDGFAETVRAVKLDLLGFLVRAAAESRSVVAYGAPGKGNTLLNHCGVQPDLLPWTVDANPNKHGMFLPGSHIPVRHPDTIAEARPDYVLVLPWNLREEISGQLEYVGDWGGQLVFPIPALEVVPGKPT